MYRQNRVIRDLEERTFEFALIVRKTLKNLRFSRITHEDVKQVLRSSGSVGSNYIEARESLSSKDRIYRLRISRKEAKESIYWLRLIKSMSSVQEQSGFEPLITEAIELKKILSSMILNAENRKKN